MSEPEASHEPVIYQLRVVLRGISPLIWRRLVVRGDSTLPTCTPAGNAPDAMAGSRSSLARACRRSDRPSVSALFRPTTTNPNAVSSKPCLHKECTRRAACQVRGLLGLRSLPNAQAP